MSFTLAFHYEVKCPDTPRGFIEHKVLPLSVALPTVGPHRMTFGPVLLHARCGRLAFATNTALWGNDSDWAVTARALREGSS